MNNQGVYNGILKTSICWLLLFMPLASVIGQVTPGKIKDYITGREAIAPASLVEQKGLEDFYAAREFNPIWLTLDGRKHVNYLGNLLQASRYAGLEESDYELSFLKAYELGEIDLQNLHDSVIAELRLSCIALKYFSHILYGDRLPEFGYDGLKYSVSGPHIAEISARMIALHAMSDTILYPGMVMEELRIITRKIEQMQKLSEQYLDEKPIISTTVGTANRPLCEKLFLLGVLDSATTERGDLFIKEKVQEIQRQFGLPSDGVLRKTILQELNVPASRRLEQLKLSLSYYRWLYQLSLKEPVIVVNIPAAYLKVYDKGKVLLQMRIIVGKRATPTPTLTSRVSEVVLYPYWTVPHSIATKELLPSIRRNRNFIDANNYQVLNRQGKIMDPHTIDWQTLSTSNFPYVIRQSTGCDNALGLLKLDFYNPFSVYLHDTPNKALFMLNKRFFSHGCMRLEDPMALGHMVLKNNPQAIDTLEQKGCLRNQSPIRVDADHKMAVVVWYNPAGIDATGRVLYFEDIYRKLDAIIERGREARLAATK